MVVHMRFRVDADPHGSLHAVCDSGDSGGWRAPAAYVEGSPPACVPPPREVPVPNVWG